VLSTHYLRILYAGILIFLVLTPVAMRDDDVRLVAYLFDSDTCDDAVAAGPQFLSGNHAHDVANPSWQFDHVEIVPIYTLEVAVLSAFDTSATTDHHELQSRPAAAAGRAPPAT
jgi:hypothetical protein